MPRLRAFQRADVEQLKAAGLTGLVASAPGTGKTAIAIRSLVETCEHSMPAAIICPASVTRNWEREFNIWGPGIHVILVDNTTDRLPRRASYANTVFIVNWALLDARWADLKHVGMKTVVADEAHYAKNPDALRSQALLELTRQAQSVMLLTGTPIVNTQAELRVLKELLKTDNPLMIRRMLEDVAPEIPAKTRNYVPITLRPKNKVNYDKADQDFAEWLRIEKARLLGEGMADYEVERALAAEAFVKIGYLRRLVGEYKVHAAVDWIARAVRIGEPVVVFLEHQNVLNRITKALRRQRIRFGVVEGATSPVDRQAVVDDFQKNKFPVFIGTRAAKEGITLTAARHLLFVERFFTAADEDQAEDRIRRIGQAQETKMWYLHATGTVDDRLDAIVQAKRSIVRSAIGANDPDETPMANVERLLRTWGEVVSPSCGPPVALGLGEPLPSLPSHKDTHAVVFSGTRWDPRGGARWCKMHGYKPYKHVVAGDEKFKLLVQPTSMFKPHSFHVVPVSKEIKLVCGQRLGRANTTLQKRTLRKANG